MPEDKNKTDLDERKMRLKRLENIKKSGSNPYPEKFDKQQTLADAKTLKEGTEVKTAGRILTIRDMGKIIFCHLQDFSGKLQVVLKEDEVGKEKLKWFLDNFDLGDFVGVAGEIFTTKKGEISILVKKYDFLGKALLPLPEKWHGLKDAELIYRQRYLDLVANEESMARFKLRSEIVKALREFYWGRGFIEVETPILCNTASGAIAKPFVTHYNALDLDVYLRIAPEIYLKECIIGGLEKVFEIGRCFRNEGMDPSHLQDFTMVEHYAAYWNYEDNMKFTEELICHLLDKFFGGRKIKIKDRKGELKEVDFMPPWPRVSLRELIKKDSGIDIDRAVTAEELAKEIKKKKIEIEGAERLSRGGLIDSLYKQVSRSKLIQPTFLIQHPLDLSPLARRSDDNPAVVDRFQLIVNTWELCNAYSELVDPLDQKERFEKQSVAKDAGDSEAHGKDDEFVEALEHGAPPISGWGLGVDRLVALLTQQDNLRDVVLFPLMRPQNKE
ncbi:MAG: lysine--tRNA ligase [Patescibacteria group bacterium]